MYLNYIKIYIHMILLKKKEKEMDMLATFFMCKVFS